MKSRNLLIGVVISLVILLTAHKTFAACSYSVSPSVNQTFDASGGAGQLTVASSTSECTWTAASNVGWLAITSGNSGTGNGIVTFAVAPNAATSDRAGELTIAGQTIPVRQTGKPAPKPEDYRLFTSIDISSMFNGGSGISAIVPDGSSVLYILTDDKVFKLDAAGKYLISWGSSGTGNGEFRGAADIAVDASGYVYVVDGNNNRIQKFDPNGSFIFWWGMEGTGNGQFSSPSGIAIDPSGTLYVMDSGNRRVQKFDLNGTFLGKWSTPGKKISVYQGNIYVTDPSAGKVHKFAPSGQLVMSWAAASTGTIAVDREGSVYVIEGVTFGSETVVVKFTSNGHFITKWGPGTSDANFIAPRALAVDSSGRVYVADAGSYSNCYRSYCTSTRIKIFVDKTQSPTPTGLSFPGRYVFSVSAYENATGLSWLDTGIDVPPGYFLGFVATGTACLWFSDYCQGPDGASIGLYNGCNYGALVGKIGTGEQFCIGSSNQKIAQDAGRLYLAYNDENYSDNSGDFSVTVSVNVATGQTSPVYRFLNTDSWFFFYTIYESERDYILQNLPQYQLNGMAYYAYMTQQPGTSPVYRFLNTDSWFFFYTIYESERDYILQNLPQYQLDGVSFYGYK